MTPKFGAAIAPSFKDKTRYTPYVCPGIQFTHIATNEGVIPKAMPLLHSAQVFVTKGIVLLYSIYYNSILPVKPPTPLE